eukprot:1012490-Rhodomonas_salina.1
MAAKGRCHVPLAPLWHHLPDRRVRHPLPHLSLRLLAPRQHAPLPPPPHQHVARRHLRRYNMGCSELDHRLAQRRSLAPMDAHRPHPGGLPLRLGLGAPVSPSIPPSLPIPPSFLPSFPPISPSLHARVWLAPPPPYTREAAPPDLAGPPAGRVGAAHRPLPCTPPPRTPSLSLPSPHQSWATHPADRPE